MLAACSQLLPHGHGAAWPPATCGSVAAAPSCQRPGTAAAWQHARPSALGRPPTPPGLEAATTTSCSPTWGRQRLRVVCMAHPRRVAKVASQIQREMGMLFITDPVLIKAINPERELGGDELSALASITDVYVSNDLQVVKVYVSVYSDAIGKKRAMDRLKRLQGYARTQIGRRMSLRLTPEIRFEYDDSQDQAELIQRFIGASDVARLKKEMEDEAGAVAGGSDGEEDGDGAGDGGAWAQQAEGRAGFFDAYEEDDAEYEAEQRASQAGRSYGRPPQEQDVFNTPGPFDDMFSGSGDTDDLLVPAPGARGAKAQGGGRGGGKGQGRGAGKAAGGRGRAGAAGGSSKGREGKAGVR